MRKPAVLLALGILAFTCGCALTHANLKVGYGPETAKKGPLSTVRPLNVAIKDFQDKRADKNRIGFKRNTYGSPTADIYTETPVPGIIKNAISAEFVKNGHRIVEADPDIVITGQVQSFWFETQTGFWTMEFMGTVGISMEVSEGKTGGVIYTGKPEGHFNEKSMGGLEGTWERVMNTALENMIQQASSDRKLIDSLKSLNEKTSGSWWQLEDVIVTL